MRVLVVVVQRITDIDAVTRGVSVLVTLPLDVRMELFAADASRPLNGRALLLWDAPLLPVADGGGLDADGIGQSTDAPCGCDCSV